MRTHTHLSLTHGGVKDSRKILFVSQHFCRQMALPPSGLCSRSNSPSATADLLSLLDIDDREDNDEISSFTLLAAPSTVSSLGPAMSHVRSARYTGHGCSSTRCVWFTFVCHAHSRWGGKDTRSRQGGGSGGGWVLDESSVQHRLAGW